MCHVLLCFATLLPCSNYRMALARKVQTNAANDIWTLMRRTFKDLKDVPSHRKESDGTGFFAGHSEYMWILSWFTSLFACIIVKASKLWVWDGLRHEVVWSLSRLALSFETFKACSVKVAIGCKPVAEAAANRKKVVALCAKDSTWHPSSIENVGTWIRMNQNSSSEKDMLFAQAWCKHA